MNTIAIIDDNARDFESIKEIFADTSKRIWPDYYDFWQAVSPEDSIDPQSLEFDDNLVSNICKQIEDNINNISAIIMDISLKGNGDDSLGIRIIDQIRNINEFKHRLIPIFCYSVNGDDLELRKDALKVGATNVFNKTQLNNQSIDAVIGTAELKITLDYHMLAYQLSVIATSTLEKIEDYLKEDAKKSDILVEMVTSLIKLDKLNEISEDADKEEMIKSIFGGDEKLKEVKKKMDRLEKINDQAEMLNTIGDVMSLIPGLNFVFPIVPKLFSLFQKRT